jgi:rod shape determining protein RodA
VFYGVALLLLVAVIFVGTKVNGARRWIDLGIGFNLQPSEFAKVGFLLMQANFLSRPEDELRHPGTFWKAIIIVLAPFLLIACEPDLGSALVLLPVSLVTMFVAGVPKMMLARLILSAVVFAGVLMVAILFLPAKYTPFVKDYQRDRIYTYFGRNPAPKNATPEARRAHAQKVHDRNYNVDQALISVGSGGFWGKGWRQGTQHSFGFLPRLGAHNDFIFSVIAEEEGFIGSVTILALYIVLLFSGIKIASQARDRLGKIMAVGVVALLFSHVFINIGMNIRMMPVTGIPLPLVSYGGSSVLCSIIAIGILHNIHIYRRSY